MNNIVIRLGFVYNNLTNFTGGRGDLYDPNGLAPTILTMQGGGNKPFVLIWHDDE